MIDGIIVILFLYLSLVLHELGHCLLPRVMGVYHYNRICIGVGKELITIKIVNLSIQFNRILIPFGYIKYTSINKEDSRDGYIHDVLHQLGGVFINFCASFFIFIIIFYLDYDFWELKNTSNNIVTYAFKSVIYSGIWLFKSGFSGIEKMIENKTNLNFSYYLYMLGTINGFIFLFNTIPLPLGINDGWVFLIKVFRRTLSRKRAKI